MLLRGEADPMQVGAFLMLLRYRGEDSGEIAAWFVEGARTATRVADAGVDLDWPSYGAGRTRGAPWFLLAALGAGRCGVPRADARHERIFRRHDVSAQALALLGLPRRRAIPTMPDGGSRRIVSPISRCGPLCPAIDDLLGVRRLLGLRSPINTVARLLDPGDAPAGVDGVFHPPYIETHLSAAEILGRPRLLVLKGGGGEAERNPRRSVAVHLWVAGRGRAEQVLAPLTVGEPDPQEPDPAALWRGEQRHEETEARIVAHHRVGSAGDGARRRRRGEADLAGQTGRADALTRR